MRHILLTGAGFSRNRGGLFREALEQFLAREIALVQKNIHEQALCGRQARYVDAAKDKRGLHQYYVDVEYDTGQTQNYLQRQDRRIHQYRL